MEYVYCDQEWWYVWRILLYTYGSAVLVLTFKQAGHVSKMTIKQLAYEGDISVRLLLVIAIVWTCHYSISWIVLQANLYYESTIFYIFGFATIPLVILAMIFLPKVIQLQIYVAADHCGNHWSIIL